MSAQKDFRWNKATDINRENAIFELTVSDIPILDVGYSDEGVFEISFNDAVGGIVLPWARFTELIEAGKRLADLDRLSE